MARWRRSEKKILAEIVRHFRHWPGGRTAAPIGAALWGRPRHGHADHSQLARDGRQVNTIEALQARVEEHNTPG